MYRITFNNGMAALKPLVVDSTGLNARDAVEHIDVVNANAGSFTLTYGGDATAPIVWNASATTDKTGTIPTATHRSTSLTYTVRPCAAPGAGDAVALEPGTPAR